MPFGEIIFVILLVLGFLGPTAYFQQWWLFGVFAVFFACFGVIEFMAVKISKKTVSQHFWALKENNPKAAWIIISGMIVGWIALLWHFMG